MAPLRPFPFFVRPIFNCADDVGLVRGAELQFHLEHRIVFRILQEQVESPPLRLRSFLGHLLQLAESQLFWVIPYPVSKPVFIMATVADAQDFSRPNSIHVHPPLDMSSCRLFGALPRIPRENAQVAALSTCLLGSEKCRRGDATGTRGLFPPNEIFGPATLVNRRIN